MSEADDVISIRAMTRSMLVLAMGAALFGVACEDKKPSLDTVSPDAGTSADKYATADPKLANALRGAADAAAGAEQGPPAAGIFEAGVADRRHAKGLPTTIEVVTAGSAPQVSLKPSTDPRGSAQRASSYGPATLQVAMQMGPRVALPTLAFDVRLGPAKPDDGGPDWLVANLAHAAPAKEQLGQLPPGSERDIASLAGTTIRIKLTPDGRESDLQMELAKAARPDLGRLAQDAAEALVFATVPLPDKPVGVGAQWIAETRMPLSGLDVIAYRAYRVKSITADGIDLSLDVKAYAADKQVSLAGIPPGATLEQFDGVAKGELELARGESLARRLDLQQQVVMVFAGPGGVRPPEQPGGPPGNLLTAQLQSQVTLARGHSDDLRAALKPR